MSKAIVFGPWTGEFSYEMSWWAPDIRKIRKERFLDHYAIHVGYIGRRALYKDFIDEYISFPEEIHNSIKYPSMCWTFEGGKHVIPENVQNFFQETINKKKQFFEDIKVYIPHQEISNRVFEDMPYGEYTHISADEKIKDDVRERLKKFKDKKRKIVCINARFRTRLGQTDHGDWKGEHWGEFIKRLITELNLNVVIMGVPKRGDYPGSMTIDDMGDLKKYKDYILDMVFEGPDSVEYQVALMQVTDCTIFGMSAAVNLAFMTKGVNIFTHQSAEHTERISFAWQRSLTNNHSRVRIFKKYKRLEYPDSPPEEVFEDFKDFWTKLKK